jgi:hypothetical protein
MLSGQLGRAQLGVAQLGQHEFVEPPDAPGAPVSGIIDASSLRIIVLPDYYALIGMDYS